MRINNLSLICCLAVCLLAQAADGQVQPQDNPIYRSSKTQDLEKMQKQIDQLQGQIKELHQLFENSQTPEKKSRRPR